MKGSGTEDVWVSSEMPSTLNFTRLQNLWVMENTTCLREGIRGFRKLDEIKIEETSFSAGLLIKKKVDLSTLSSEEILDVMGSMISKLPILPRA